MFDAKKLLDALTAATSEATENVRKKSDDLPGLARDIFGHAKDGVASAARDIDAKTGAGAQIDELVRNLSGGRDAGDLLNSAKEWAGDNKVAAGTILGGLGALLLGTRTGRGLTLDAAKLGGLILIGGLAYDAYKRHTSGDASVAESDHEIPPPPTGSGFEATAISDASALRYVEAMIAAAAADGKIDAAERQHLIGGLRQAGIDDQSAELLEDLVANPPSPKDLATGVNGLEEATRVYTAARLTADPDTIAERDFLDALAVELGLDQDLAGSIEDRVASVRTTA